MVKIKICGVKRIEDAEMLNGLADYVGLIVDPDIESPRRVEKETARKIVEILDRSVPVAVVRTEKAIPIAAEVGAKIVQYHSDIVNIYEILDLSEKLGLKLAPVVIYHGDIDNTLARLRELAETGEDYPYILIDADKKLRKTYEKGLKLPLELVEKATSVHARVGIAGGINPKNVDLVLRCRPYLIDVASGVEKEPGIKSIELIRSLVEKVRKLEKATY